jgi:OOP family OmpA-OmpF porin
MKIAFNTNEIVIAAACALALGVMSGTAGAQSVDDRALVTNTATGAWMNGFGECWHSGFGPGPTPNFACGPQPVAQYVIPAASPAPVPVVIAAAVPSAAVWEKVSIDANVLFDSDRSALNAAGRSSLDQFVARIHGLDSQNIMAIGYADRMGTDAANQRLSQQRVDAVKGYLVGKGIESSRVKTSAKGEMQPSTYASECKDANNTKNVACMQSDRHVFIQVSGNRIAKQ